MLTNQDRSLMFHVGMLFLTGGGSVLTPEVIEAACLPPVVDITVPAPALSSSDDDPLSSLVSVDSEKHGRKMGGGDVAGMAVCLAQRSIRMHKTAIHSKYISEGTVSFSKTESV